MITRSGTHSSPNHLIHPSCSASSYDSKSKCSNVHFTIFTFWKYEILNISERTFQKSFKIIFIFCNISLVVPVNTFTILEFGSIEVVADDRSEQVIKSCKSAVWNKHVELDEVGLYMFSLKMCQEGSFKFIQEIYPSSSSWT